SGDDCDTLTSDAVVTELCADYVDELGKVCANAVEGWAGIDGAKPASKRGNELGIGIAERQVAHPLGHGSHRQIRRSRAGTHARAAASFSDPHATLLQASISLCHRHRTDTELLGETPHGWQPLAWPDPTPVDRELERLGDLGCRLAFEL